MSGAIITMNNSIRDQENFLTQYLPLGGQCRTLRIALRAIQNSKFKIQKDGYD